MGQSLGQGLCRARTFPQVRGVNSEPLGDPCQSEREGLLRLTQNGGPVVHLSPDLVAAFDRFLAAGMSGHDLIYNLALRQAA